VIPADGLERPRIRALRTGSTSESHTQSRILGRPGTSCPSNEDGQAEHGAFQSCSAIDVISGLACQFPGGVEAWYGFPRPVQYMVLQVGVDAAEAFAGQREELYGMRRRLLYLLPSSQPMRCSLVL